MSKSKKSADKVSGEVASMDVASLAVAPESSPVATEERETSLTLLKRAIDLMKEEYEEFKTQLSASREETARLEMLMSQYGESVDKTIQQFMDEAFPRATPAKSSTGRRGRPAKTSSTNGSSSSPGPKPDGLTSKQLVEQLLRSKANKTAAISEIKDYFTKHGRSQPGPTLSAMTKDGSIEATSRGVYKLTGK